jgi:biopolymer transport protein ExbB
MGLLKFIMENFWHVAPILACGFLAVVIGFERFTALMWKYTLSVEGAFFEKVRNLVMEDKVNEAIVFCQRFNGKLVAEVVKEGLKRAHQPETIIEDGLKIAVGRAQEKVQARTPFLATIANVSTLLGLFGTIVGLVQSFEAVGSASAQMRSAMLAAGISTAMNATMLGLAVAIPCMIIYSFLMNRTNKLNAQLEQSAIATLDILKQRYYTESPHDARMKTPRHLEAI